MNEQEKLINNRTDTQKAVEKPPVSSIIPEGTAYYPGFGKYGKNRWQRGQLVPYAAACIEIVKLLNDKAASKYKEVVTAFQEPKVQAIWQNLQQKGLTAQFVADIHDLPHVVDKAMEEFVLLGFNRGDDIKNGCPKVTLDSERSAPLYTALATNAATDAIGVNVPLHDDTTPGSVLSLFGSDPKARPERRRKSKLIASFHKHGFGAVSKQTLHYGAELWYKSRVDPGKLVLVCDLLYHEGKSMGESVLSRWIEPYDHATGYPR